MKRCHLRVWLVRACSFLQYLREQYLGHVHYSTLLSGVSASRDPAGIRAGPGRLKSGT